ASQAAWSTGAGWGLLLTYAVYSRKKENPVVTSATLGFGNNLASLLAALAVIPTVFSFFYGQNLAQEKALDVLRQGNEGLTFKWIPNLFAQIPSGSFFLALFFLALCFAAFSSLIAQLELITRIFMDGKFSRKKAVLLVGATCFVLGLPSAISLGFFNNQDHVWGLGLMVSGSFFIFMVLKIGPKRFREEIITSPEHKIKLGKAFDILIKFFLPVQILAMLVWWFWDSYKGDPENWLNILSRSSVGTVLFQWGVAVTVFILLNRFITKRFVVEDNDD
ncbi:MAG: sodium-dependent transporter, partial [Candidatus Aminicenantaceae bacterium]